jgi:hypothetical protein
MVFQANGVNKALASESRMCEKKHIVVFNGAYSYVQNKTTGDVIPLRRKNGVWLLEVRVEKHPKPTEGFTGQASR